MIDIGNNYIFISSTKGVNIVKKQWVYVLSFMLITLLLIACNDDQTGQENQDKGEEAVESNATAEEEVLVSLENNEGQVVGTATLTEGEEGVHISLEGEDLPAGEHGFHIHEVGKCELPDFESAGSHYNPTNAKHGFNHPEGPHAGDLENITVNEDGTVQAEVDAPMVTLQADTENTLYTEQGTSLMIHSGPDDYRSQPSGDAGDRIACGVIGE